MTTRKNSSNQSNIGSLSVEGVREWRSSIEQFFLEDWKSVSEIVLKLEKTLWDDVRTKEVRTERPAYVSAAQELGITSVLRDELSSTPPPPKSSDPKQNSRLEELALKIEQRLKTNHEQSMSESS
ncbi:hypothetical protein [Thalassoglobus polymorphus]|uniref:Uncharacterized protein n=1 Tax=Thalassoglobus polymorphus TaxID=2527994 RepID=A0A517QP31_9PLAN|nr:hypothetical protein [Thalassoglobus polymorphus]QDT33375.1 hypothetical protein Mal48_26280 [Thalassoglobus polymorphus]